MDLRQRLRAAPVFPAGVPDFDPASAPAHPAALFEEWFAVALAAGQLAPHAMTLSTANADGNVSARVLILKDIDDRGWQFATHATSPKAGELSANPFAALTFFWPIVGRQVRVSGASRRLPRREAEADFLARPFESRAATLVGHQSEVLRDASDLARAAEDATRILEGDQAVVDEDWALYAVDPTRIEFWQASHDRAHLRLLYRRDSGTHQGAEPRVEEAWTKEILWP